MDFKWYAIMMACFAVAGAIAMSVNSIASSNSVSACVSAGMEWRDGDCLKATDDPK